MKESDWKTFKVIKEKALERFCDDTLNQCSKVISNQSESVHDRYLKLYRVVKNRDKEMALLFDGHSRYNAPMQLLGLRSRGLADDALLAKLSEEFLSETDPKPFID